MFCDNEEVEPVKAMTIINLNNDSITPKLYVFVAVFFTATNSIFFKLSTVPAMVFVSGRFFICALFFALIVAFRGLRRKSQIRNVSIKSIGLFLMVGCIFSFGAFAYFIALKNTALTSVLILTSTNAIFVVLLSFIILKDKPGFWVVLSIMVTIAGCIIVFSGRGSGGNSVLGNVCALICPMCSAVYTVIMKKYSSMNVPMRLCMVYTGSFIFALVVAIIQSSSFVFLESGQLIPYYEYLCMVCSGLFSVCIPQYLINCALRDVKASFVGSTGLLEPVIGTVYGIFLWGEALTVNQIAGGIIVLCGLYFYNQAESKIK